MFKQFVSTVFVLALVSGCSGSSPPEGNLLLSSNQTGNWEVFMFDTESSTVWQVTQEAGYEPEFGARIEGFDLEGAWSPDGKQIVLTSDRYGTSDLLVVDHSGSVLKILTPDDWGSWEPAWSPDGSRIAFRSDRTGDVELFVMDADGSNIRQVTDSPGEDWTPTWSPDGSVFAFASRRSNGSWDLFTTRPDGTEISQLTEDLWDNWVPDWSPDGTQIAYASNPNGNWDIFTMNSDGTSIRQLTDEFSEDLEPVWSPDGTQLAFASDRSGIKGWEIFFVDLETGEISGSGQAGYPSDWLGEIPDSG